MTAVQCGNLGNAELLIEKGANLNMMNEEGAFALAIAITKNNLEMVKLLIAKGANLNLHGKDGLTALIASIGEDYMEIVELLLDKGYEVHGLIRRASTFNTKSRLGLFLPDNK